MKIRTKSIIIFLLLSLTPLALIGAIAYKNAEVTTKKYLGSTFQQMSHAIIDKIDQRLYEVYRNVQALTDLDLMQEVITGDVDGRITSFLMGLSKEYGNYSSIDVLSSEGEVIASSNPELIGRDFNKEDFYKNTIGGKAYVEDVHLDEISQRWVVIFSFPIKAQFEEEKIIGVLCAKWKADKLPSITKLPLKEGSEERQNHLMLMRGDGLVISAPEFEKEDIFKRNLIKAGLKSALLASRKEEGYLVETDEHKRNSLIGYSYSRGYGDFSGVGWFVFVMEDIETAFAPIERLKFTIFGLGAVVALFVIIISLIAAGKMTNPILKISQVAARVARGDLECRVDYSSGDEIGNLTKTFNRMIKDLKTQRAQLVDKDYVDSIITNMIDALIVVDPDTKIKTINPATVKLLGYKEDELLGKSVASVFTGNSFKREVLDDLIEKGFVPNVEKFCRSKDGSKIPVLFSGSVMRDKTGKMEGIVCLALNITKRKRAEEELKKKTERLERFHKITVEREFDMVRLKDEINALLEKSGMPKKYKAPGKISIRRLGQTEWTQHSMNGLR